MKDLAAVRYNQHSINERLDLILFLVCRNRMIRCDRRRPSCLNCNKSRRQCHYVDTARTQESTIFWCSPALGRCGTKVTLHLSWASNPWASDISGRNVSVVFGEQESPVTIVQDEVKVYDSTTIRVVVPQQPISRMGSRSSVPLFLIDDRSRVQIGSFSYYNTPLTGTTSNKSVAGSSGGNLLKLGLLPDTISGPSLVLPSFELATHDMDQGGDWTDNAILPMATLEPFSVRLAATPSLVQSSSLAPQISSALRSPGLSPPKASLEIKGDLGSMTKAWSEDECRVRRRLVLFRSTRSAGTIKVSFQAIKPHGQPSSGAYVSCIRLGEKAECYITLADIISILEAMVVGPSCFTIEQNYWIRRNLKRFRPQKFGMPRGEEISETIMAIPNPKPRGIGKNIMIFPWRIVSDALKEIVSKYSASLSSEFRPSLRELGIETTPPTSPQTSPLISPQFLDARQPSWIPSLVDKSFSMYRGTFGMVGSLAREAGSSCYVEELVSLPRDLDAGPNYTDSENVQIPRVGNESDQAPIHPVSPERAESSTDATDEQSTPEPCVIQQSTSELDSGSSDSELSSIDYSNSNTAISRILERNTWYTVHEITNRYREIVGSSKGEAPCDQGGGKESATGCGSSNQPSSSANSLLASMRPKRGRKRRGSDDGGEHEHHGAKMPRSASPQPRLKNVLKIACHYYQRNRQGPGIGRSCAGPGWDTIHRLK